jgi:hypothetical protein
VNKCLQDYPHSHRIVSLVLGIIIRKDFSLPGLPVYEIRLDRLQRQTFIRMTTDALEIYQEQNAHLAKIDSIPKLFPSKYYNRQIFGLDETKPANVSMFQKFSRFFAKATLAKNEGSIQERNEPEFGAFKVSAHETGKQNQKQDTEDKQGVTTAPEKNRISIRKIMPTLRKINYPNPNVIRDPSVDSKSSDQKINWNKPSDKLKSVAAAPTVLRESSLNEQKKRDEEDDKSIGQLLQSRSSSNLNSPQNSKRRRPPAPLVRVQSLKDEKSKKSVNSGSNLNSRPNSNAQLQIDSNANPNININPTSQENSFVSPVSNSSPSSPLIVDEASQDKSQVHINVVDNNAQNNISSQQNSVPRDASVSLGKAKVKAHSNALKLAQSFEQHFNSDKKSSADSTSQVLGNEKGGNEVERKANPTRRASHSTSANRLSPVPEILSPKSSPNPRSRPFIEFNVATNEIQTLNAKEVDRFSDAGVDEAVLVEVNLKLEGSYDNKPKVITLKSRFGMKRRRVYAAWTIQRAWRCYKVTLKTIIIWIFWFLLKKC